MKDVREVPGALPRQEEGSQSLPSGSTGAQDWGDNPTKAEQPEELPSAFPGLSWSCPSLLEGDSSGTLSYPKKSFIQSSAYLSFFPSRSWEGPGRDIRGSRARASQALPS